VPGYDGSDLSVRSSSGEATTVHPSLDMSDPAVNKVFKQLADENAYRDQLAQTLAKASDNFYSRTVYLDCSDDGLCHVAKGGMSDSNSGSTHTVDRIAEEVGNVLNGGSPRTSLKHSFWKNIALVNHLDGQSQTFDPPMMEHNTGYWSTKSRPYETKLIDALSKSKGEITFGQLTQDALGICNGDKQLTILTLANFSKNMAAIERRQIKPSDIASGLKSDYTEVKIDAIFHRLEPLTDSRENQYNKEGAVYHLFGAMLAGSQWGQVAEAFVDGDNSSLSTAGPDSRTDKIKDAAGLNGAKVGLSVMGFNPHPGPFARFGLGVLSVVSIYLQEDAL